jgi:hypothetical protein
MPFPFHFRYVEIFPTELTLMEEIWLRPLHVISTQLSLLLPKRSVGWSSVQHDWYNSRLGRSRRLSSVLHTVRGHGPDQGIFRIRLSKTEGRSDAFLWNDAGLPTNWPTDTSKWNKKDGNISSRLHLFAFSYMKGRSVGHITNIINETQNSLVCRSEGGWSALITGIPEM